MKKLTAAVFASFALLSNGVSLVQEAYATPPEKIRRLATSLVKTVPRNPYHLHPCFSNLSSKLSFAVRFPSEHINTLPLYGFLNQYQTGTSGGFLDNSRRLRAEKQFVSMSHLKLGQPGLTSLFPKYGFLSDVEAEDEFSPGLNHMASQQYGDVLFILKNEVAERSTFSIGDTLDFEPKVYRFENLDEYQELNENELIQFENAYEASLKIEALRQRMLDNYLEFQVWGSLNLKDVKEIWIQNSTPVTALETLCEMAELNRIPIYFIDKKQGIFGKVFWRKSSFYGGQEKFEIPAEVSAEPARSELIAPPVDQLLLKYMAKETSDRERLILSTLICEHSTDPETVPDDLKAEARSRIHLRRKMLLGFYLGTRANSEAQNASFTCLLSEKPERSDRLSREDVLEILPEPTEDGEEAPSVNQETNVEALWALEPLLERDAIDCMKGFFGSKN